LSKQGFPAFYPFTLSASEYSAAIKGNENQKYTNYPKSRTTKEVHQVQKLGDFRSAIMFIIQNAGSTTIGKTN